MQHLGSTRSTFKIDHLLQTPDSFVRSPLPGADGVEFVIHTAPQNGAGFSQMTAEFSAGGSLGPAPAQRFVYVLEGEVEVSVSGKTHGLAPGGYAYLPQSAEHSVRAAAASRAAVIEKTYVPFAGATPEIFIGDQSKVAPFALMGDEGLRVQTLMPDGAAYDFAVNIMTFDPGAALSLVEMHRMEHGLVMLEGGGIYRVGDSWYSVQTGDFIWMRAFCPQWFGAIGKKPAKYLIYKDWRRHPLEG